MRRRIRETSIIQQREKIPLIRRLSLEVPENPTLSHGLECIKLCFNVLTRVVLVRLVPAAYARHAVAGAMVNAIETTVVAGATIVACGGIVGS